MRMHPALRFGLEDPIVSFEAGPDAVHVEGSAAVGYKDAMAPYPSMSKACCASASGSIIWLIIRKPETSMPRSRDIPICCFAKSASVHWVAPRTERHPRRGARTEQRREG